MLEALASGEAALVAFNRGEQEFRWTLPDDTPADLKVALATDDAVDVEISGEGAERFVVLPGLTGVVLASP